MLYSAVSGCPWEFALKGFLLFPLNFRLLSFVFEKLFNSTFSLNPDRFVSDCRSIDRDSNAAIIVEKTLRLPFSPIFVSPFLLLLIQSIGSSPSSL